MFRRLPHLRHASLRKAQRLSAIKAENFMQSAARMFSYADFLLGAQPLHHRLDLSLRQGKLFRVACAQHESGEETFLVEEGIASHHHVGMPSLDFAVGCTEIALAQASIERHRFELLAGAKR